MIDPTEAITPAVVRALALAGRIAASEQSPTITALHIVRALFADEPEGMAASAAIRHGYPADGPLFQLSIELNQTTNSFGRHSQELAAALRIWPKVAPQLDGEVLLRLLLGYDPTVDQLFSSWGMDTESFRQSMPMELEPIPIVEPLTIVETTESAGVARIIDANINRASEATRVLEDYARFVVNDAGLCRTCKNIRHQLRDLPRTLGLSCLTNRDVSQDVGTSITTASEYRRADSHEVVTANSRRLQEALRSLEEYAKTRSPSVAKMLEAMRYDGYTVESSLASVRTGLDRLVDVKLYWLYTRAACRMSPQRAICDAIEGGVGMIQLREKSLTDSKLLARAKEVRKWTRDSGIPFIVNDRVDVARLAGADGVHLGQDDVPVSSARAILGRDAIIGVSTHNIEQVVCAVRDGASYIGVGPTFPSSTKEFAEFAGLDFVRQVAAETSLPAFILGGVTAENLPHIIAAGGKRVAVSAAISTSEYPREAARSLLIP